MGTRRGCRPVESGMGEVPTPPLLLLRAGGNGAGDTGEKQGEARERDGNDGKEVERERGKDKGSCCGLLYWMPHTSYTKCPPNLSVALRHGNLSFGHRGWQRHRWPSSRDSFIGLHVFQARERHRPSAPTSLRQQQPTSWR